MTRQGGCLGSKPGLLRCDPFDRSEYQYIAWRGVAQATFERFLGEPFTATDFTAENQAIAFPTDWGAMF